MKITEETILKIEKVFNINLYEDQKKYLLLDNCYWVSSRQSGKAFVYSLKLALSEGDVLDFGYSGYSYIDEYHGSSYNMWFKRYFYDIYTKLKENGFEVREAIFTDKKKRG